MSIKSAIFAMKFVPIFNQNKISYKMKLNFRSLLIATLALGMMASMSACKKDKKSKTELLTNNSWKVKASIINPAIDLFGNGQLVTDLYANTLFYPACRKDDFMTFKDNGQVVSDEGPTKCDAADVQTTTQNWTFNSDETVVTITELDGTDPVSITMTALSENELKITETESIDNVVYTFTTTFEPK